MRTEGTNESQVTLKIPRPLYVQLKQVIQGSGFHSVTEFVVYVLRPFLEPRTRGAKGIFLCQPRNLLRGKRERRTAVTGRNRSRPPALRVLGYP